MNKAFSSLGSFLLFKISPIWLLGTAAGLTAFATIIGYLGSLWWIFDLFAHFRIQYFLILSACFAVLVAVKKMRAWSLAVLPFIALNFVSVAPLYFGGDSACGKTEMRALLINVLAANKQYHMVRDFIKKSNADFVVLLEVTDQWDKNLKELQADYPYFMSFPRNNNFGISFFSKQKPEKLEMPEFSDITLPAVLADFIVDGKRLTLVGAHIMPPRFEGYLRKRKAQFDGIASFVKSGKKNVIVLGDLNATPWSADFKKFMRKSGLKDSQNGFGAQPSWPAFSVLFPLLIPIDHCLVSKNLSISDRKIGGYVGSDHFPLTVDFSIK